MAIQIPIERDCPACEGAGVDKDYRATVAAAKQASAPIPDRAFAACSICSGTGHVTASITLEELKKLLAATV